jgi:2-polyprenyl-3-methyl-5-hydroxy-6-metoxy-1,4-benzoquinol methylase
VTLPAVQRRGQKMDHTWAENYRTTQFLESRLAALRQFSVSDDAFGMEHLNFTDIDQKSVLNIGCGTGFHDAECLTRTRAKPMRYVLSDKSPAMARAAYLRISKLIGSVESQSISVDDMRPDNIGSFDLIICMHVLYHVSDPLFSLKNISKLLDRNGVLLITTVSSKSKYELYSLHNRILRQQFQIGESELTGSRFNTANALDIVGQVFSEIKCHYKIAHLIFTDAAAVIEYYTSLPYFQDAVDRGAKPTRLINNLRENVEKQIAGNGYFRCNMDTVTLLAARPRPGL